MHTFRFPLFPISRAQARPPRPPPIVCLVECSFAAVSVGLFSAVTTALGNIAATLPPYAEIALIAYDDAVHFFSFGDTGIVQLTAPDANEACLPLPPSRLLFSLGESLDSSLAGAVGDGAAGDSGTSCGAQEQDDAAAASLHQWDDLAGAQE